MTTDKKYRVVCLLFGLALLSACAAPVAALPTEAATSAPTLAPSPSHTPSATATSSPTATPTPTSSATSTPSPTASPTPTRTRTPRPIPTSTPVPVLGVVPGTYPMSGACATYHVSQVKVTEFLQGPRFETMEGDVTWCINSVVVAESGDMEYKVSWSIPPDQGNHVTKLSYRNDPGMYLIDNFGNHYSFTGLTGAALDGCTLEANSPNATAYGSFIFPKAQPGATAFTFHDDDTHYAITINLGVPVH